MSEDRTPYSIGGSFQYGEDMITYEVIESSHLNENKKPKIAIKVHPDGRVIVLAPIGTTADKIQQAVVKRARWVWENIRDFKAQHDWVLPKRYVSGEACFYLGRRYVLKVVEDGTKTSSIKLFRGKLMTSLKKFDDNNSKRTKALLDKWYAHKANLLFKERLRVLVPQTDWVTDIPKFKIMSMSKQWGSCSSKGTLMLNPHLIKASKECIDYVILHELCHIAEHNHSEKFWRLLTQTMPHWKEVKEKLDGNAELYLNE
jgi:predicted metal-dependent hydrolase